MLIYCESTHVCLYIYRFLITFSFKYYIIDSYYYTLCSSCFVFMFVSLYCMSGCDLFIF